MKRILLLVLIGASPIVGMSGFFTGSSSSSGSGARNKNEASKMLIYRASYGTVQDVQKELAQGADVNFVESDGLTPLIAATSSKRAEIIKLLINNGADVNFVVPNHGTALMVAVMRGNQDMAELLIRSGARVNQGNRGGITPLMRAVDNNFPLLVQFLLDQGADPDQRDSFVGITARERAKGKPEIERLFAGPQRERERFAADDERRRAESPQGRAEQARRAAEAEQRRRTDEQERMMRAERERYEAFQRDRARFAQQQSQQQSQQRPPERPMDNAMQERQNLEQAGREFRQNRGRIQALRVLGLGAAASRADIRKRWLALSLEYHPDKNPGENTGPLMQLINDAHDFLTK